MNNPLVIPLVSAIAASALTLLVAALRNKTAVIQYTTRVDPIALATEDPIFGTIRVSWQDNDVPNLHLATVEVHNGTMRDFAGMDIAMFSATNTVMLTERTGISSGPYIVEWSDTYKGQMAVPNGSLPSEAQWEKWRHRRDYTVPVLNRGDTLQFTYLCLSSDGELPGVFASSLSKGIKLRYQVLPVVPGFIMGVQIGVASGRGLVIAGLAVITCGVFLRNIWLAAVISMLVGLTAQLLGALQYKAERFIRNLIAG